MGKTFYSSFSCLVECLRAFHQHIRFCPLDFSLFPLPSHIEDFNNDIHRPFA